MEAVTELRHLLKIHNVTEEEQFTNVFLQWLAQLDTEGAMAFRKAIKVEDSYAAFRNSIRRETFSELRQYLIRSRDESKGS